MALNETGQILQGIDPGPIWTSQQPAVTSVDDQGCITGLSPGETRILARSEDRPEITATIGIRVPAASAPSLPQTQGFDFNGDGQRDWIIGYGSQYRLFMGDGGPLPVNALKPEKMAIFQFPNAEAIQVEERLYPTNAVTGDLNCDGNDDIVFSHKFGVNTGEVAIFFGSPYPLKVYNLLSPDVLLPPAPRVRPSAIIDYTALSRRFCLP